MWKRKGICWSLLWLAGTIVAMAAISFSLPRMTNRAANDLAHESTELTAADGRMDDSFGTAVAIHGDVVLVGAPYARGPEATAGAAYLFSLRRNARRSDTLVPQKAKEGSLFGWSVAISGETAVVGAPEADGAQHQSGTAYFFEVDATGRWHQKEVAAPVDTVPGDHFGHAVAISDDLALVAAPFHASGAGTVYAFRRDTSGNWRQIDSLRPAGPAASGFGWSVGLSGQTAIIGSLGDITKCASCGAAYVFRCNDTGHLIQVAMLRPGSDLDLPWFGWSVAISGETVVVGERAAAGRMGAAYVYQCDATNSWKLQARLIANDVTEHDSFADCVAIAGNQVVIGAPRHDDRRGAAYLFRSDASAWNLAAKYTASAGRADDWFGASVAAGDRQVLIGAPQDDAVALNAGAVHVFESVAAAHILRP